MTDFVGVRCSVARYSPRPRNMVGDNKSFSVSRLIGSRFPVHGVLNHSYRHELACAGGWERGGGLCGGLGNKPRKPYRLFIYFGIDYRASRGAEPHVALLERGVTI